MKIQVSQLVHHPKNAEIYDLDDIDELAASIEQVGLLNPLVIDRDNQVISGNRRLEAVKVLGWNAVEVNRIDVDDNDVVKLIVHHNHTRIKKYRELLREYHSLNASHERHQGKRNDLSPGGKKQDRREVIAKTIGLNRTALTRLLSVEKEFPELVERIDEGAITLGQAYNYVRRNGRKTNQSKHGETTPIPVSNELKKSVADYFDSDDLILLERFIREQIDQTDLDKNGLMGILRKIRLNTPFADAAD